jgi:uncharacterized Zn-binding protein involved in type VI secretion
MATVPVVAKSASSAVPLNSMPIATSGDTLQYTRNKGQELWLFNTSSSAVTVTIDGNAGVAVLVPGTAGTTVDVTAGLPISIPAEAFVYLPLDRAEAFLQGVVFISASTGSVVRAVVTTL